MDAILWSVSGGSSRRSSDVLVTLYYMGGDEDV